MMISLVVIASALFLWSYEQPYFWTLEVSEVAETMTEAVKTGTITENYRTFDVRFNAFNQLITFSAGPLQPDSLPLYLFWLFQLVAWSYLLTISTYIRSRWVYFFFLLFVLFIHFSGVAVQIYPADDWHVLEFLIMIFFLGIAYVFQSDTLKWKLPARFLSIASFSVIIFGTALAKTGTLGLHQMATDSYFYLIVLTLAFLFFIGKEPTNLIIAATTNHPEKKKRLDIRLIIGIFALLFLAEFVLLDEFLRLGLLPWAKLGIRPAHLIFVCGIAVVFTSQHHYPTVKSMFSANAVFSGVILCWSLIVLSFLFYNFAAGDFIFTYSIERLSILFFFTIGLAHTLFIFGNHRKLLSEKVNLYYLLPQGIKFGFTVVWLMGMILIIFGEGREGWKSLTLISHTYANQIADHAFMEGDIEKAMNSYRVAVDASPVSIKSNYNLACLTLSDPEKIGEAVEKYLKATDLHEFPYARINAASLLWLNNQREDAIRVLKAGSKDEINTYLANNLGWMYLKQDEPDSAITAFKQSLLADLNLSSVYSNLAQLYRFNDKPDLAKSFFEASIDVRNPSIAANTNALFYQLASGESLNKTPTPKDNNEDYFLSYNYVLSQLKQEKDNIDRNLLKKLARQDNSPDAMMLDAYMMFEEDSIAHAVSQFEWVNEYFPRYAGSSNYLLGLLYLKNKVPEMARKYFNAQGEAGEPKGFLYATQMAIDLGEKESSSFRLGALRAEHEELWEPAARELALLLAAYNQPLYAQTEWNLESLTLQERIRLSIYADSMNQYITALENFRQILEKDSSTVIPYLEMGRIYNQYKDSLAIENLTYGLQKAPDYQPLRVEQARAFLFQNDPQPAEKLLKDPNLITNENTQILTAELALAKKDTLAAINVWENFLEKNPLSTQALLALTDIFWNQDSLGKGSTLLSAAINLNTENPYLWYQFAKFTQAWNLTEDAGYAANRAIELVKDPQWKAKLESEFEEELRTIADEE